MTLHDSVRDRLRAIEALLRETEHWQETAPDSSAFASDKPFCLDTLEPLVAVNKPSGWLVHRSWLDRDEKVVV
ncbi:YqcC family protein, partial [Klebsiella pneumoniae]|uniref:YqcC family protein n=1 Tax=Klebsiella pneumoniae TaxID=573 RepID=UPI0028F8AF22